MRLVTASRSCGRSTALERTFWVETQVYYVAALPAACTVVSVATISMTGTKARSGCTTSTGRSSTPSRAHSQPQLAPLFSNDGAHRRGVGCGCDARRPHIISGAGDTLVKVWSVANKSLMSTCAGHADTVAALAVMPDGQLLSGGGLRPHRPRVAPRQHPREHLRAAHQLGARRGAARQPARALWLGDATVKLFNVSDGAVLRIFRHHTDSVKCLALLPDGPASSAARRTRPPASSSMASPEF